MIKTSIYRPILMLMVLATFAVIGIYTFRLTSINMMPEVEIPFITVQIIYPGAGPKEIETSVVEKVEEALSLIDGVEDVTTVANEGYCFIVLKFKMKTDVNVAANDVKDKLESIRSDLPTDIQDPVVSKFDMNDQPIVNLALLGPGTPVELRRVADESIEEELAQVPGVALVNILGGLEREILVELRKADMEAHHVTLDQLVQIIRGSNLDFPLGSIKQGRKEISIRLAAQFDDLSQLAAMPVPTATGIIRLSDVATIKDGFKDVTEVARFNGKTAVGIAIRKRSDANIIEVADGVIKKMDQLSSKLPPGYSLELVRNNATFIRSSVEGMYANIGLGIFLTAIVLLVFLANWRSTIIAAVTMPISLVSTFSFMYFSGFTLNFMTLMALGIAVGLLVTNAIVVIENIVVHLDRGEEPKEASEKGTSEIFVAVMASTLTNVAVFVPIAFMQSIVGSFFKEFGLTMVYATFVSLLISFTLTPMMAAYMMKKGVIKKQAVSDKGLFARIRHGYAVLLDATLTKGGLVVLFLVVIAAFASMVMVLPRLGSEFVPKTDEGALDITIEMPSGSRIQRTDETAKLIEQRLASVPGIQKTYTAVGGQGDFFSAGGAQAARISVQILPRTQRDYSIYELIGKLRPMLADIPDATIRVISVASAGGGPGQADMEIQVLGSDEDNVIKAQEILLSILDTMPGAVEVQSSWKSGKPELVLRPVRHALADFGLVPGQVAATIRGIIYGTEAGVYREKGEEVEINLRLAEQDRSSATQILGLTMSTMRGPAPISALAEASQQNGPTQVSRKDKLRLITVTGNVMRGYTLGQVQQRIEQAVAGADLPEGTQVFFGGDAEMMADAIVDFLVAIIMAILLTYILLAAILESFSQPVIIMTTIPLGAIGVVWSLYLTSMSISIISLMAMVMLIGVVVNNAILILDEANQRRRRGHESLRESIVHASKDKFQAIMMTNIAAVFSMLPLALGLSEGSEMQQPMAVASIGGLIVSTAMTLFLIPALVYIPDALKRKLAR